MTRRLVIVGAGPAGCAAAIALAPHWDVTLVSDGRCGVGETLSPACRPLLAELGLLPLDQLACLGVESHWHGLRQERQALQHPLGAGWLLDRPSFERTLRARALQAGARLLEPCRFLDVRPGWELDLSLGRRRCDFILDATGRRASVARRLGARRTVTRRQTAVVGTLEGFDPDQTLCVESSGPDWAYTCRTGARTRVATWLSFGRPRPADWWPNLSRTRRVMARLEGYLPVRLRSVPADESFLERPWGPGWLALGDAARSRDPLSGSGIFWALASGLEAARILLGSQGRAPQSRIRLNP